MQLLKNILLTIAALLTMGRLAAHPMPHSVLLLDVKHDRIDAELQWPLKELQLAFPDEELDTNVQTLSERKGAWLNAYLMQHMRVTDSANHPWQLSIVSRRIDSSVQDYTGAFNELVYQLQIIPPAGVSPRHFTVYYDAIMHQVITHKLYITIRQDWDGGLSEKDSLDAQLGVLTVNTRDNTVTPLVVHLDEGSRWKGFKCMVLLGIDHIADGTDHLLFLLVLLLPAPLLAANNRWTKTGGYRYSIVRLLRIVTAFTIGHSITLLFGAAGWVQFPSKPVEVLIAVSILIGALHALRPLFAGKEMYVAGFFGLIHGLAFATTLANLRLDRGRMALSILGFNVGIELMQLLVIFLTVPWLIVLSNYRVYKWVRIVGGSATAIAALAWIIERVTDKPNYLSVKVELIAAHGNYLLGLLALLALVHAVFMKKSKAVRVPDVDGD